jgi:hypothetical protein
VAVEAGTGGGGSGDSGRCLRFTFLGGLLLVPPSCWVCRIDVNMQQLDSCSHRLRKDRDKSSKLEART